MKTLKMGAILSFFFQFLMSTACNVRRTMSLFYPFHVGHLNLTLGPPRSQAWGSNWPYGKSNSGVRLMKE